MCGIAAFWNYSKLPEKLPGQFHARGPDSQRRILLRDQKLILFHSLLRVSPNSYPQPFELANVLVLFNGELYEPTCLFGATSEVAHIAKTYLEHGIYGIRALKGEFSIIIVDTDKNVLYVVRDFFGTKPLFILNGTTSFAISSISDSILSISEKNQSKPLMIAENSITTFCLNTGDVLATSPFISLIEIGQQLRETTIDDWKVSFLKSIQQRIPLVGTPYINLSSGHDSGLIAACLDYLQINSCFYILPRGEELMILQQRIDFLTQRGHTVKILDLQDDIRSLAAEILDRSDHVQFLDHRFQFIDPVRPDPASVGHLVTALYARSENKIVGLSGQGADELYSGYGLFGVPLTISKNIPDRTSFEPSNFPWMHAMEGHMKRYLLKDEIIASLTSTETRYPFLDHDLFFALMGLSREYFTNFYKGPIEYMLMSLSFPYSKTRFKKGFNPLSMDRSSEFLEHFSEHVVGINSEVLGELVSTQASSYS